MVGLRLWLIIQSCILWLFIYLFFQILVYIKIKLSFSNLFYYLLKIKIKNTIIWFHKIAVAPCSIILRIFWKSFLFIAYLQFVIIFYLGFPNLRFEVWLINLPRVFIESARELVFKFFFYISSKIFLFWFIIYAYDFRNCLRLAIAIELSPFTKRNLILLTASAISVLMDILVCESFSILMSVYLSLYFYLVGNVNVESSYFAPTYSIRSCMIYPII